MTIKEQVREYLKSSLKFSKTNPELFAGFLFGFVLILVLAGVMFMRVLQKPEIQDNKVTEDEMLVLTQLPEESQEPTVLPVIYVVQKGDSSWKIAKAFYGCGESYVEIEKANGLEADSLLEVGQQLLIPSVENTCSKSQLSGSTEQSEELLENNLYEVVAGDCLWSIALEQTGNPYKWVEIYKLNKPVIGSNPDLIYPGTKLVLPQGLQK